MSGIKKINIVEAVMEQILSHVRSGRFVEGERIPAERELTVELQVSRTALREAVKRLQAMGILVVRHGDGTYLDPCAKQNETMYHQKVKTLLELGKVGIQDFIHARLMLESSAVLLVVERAEENEIERLSTTVDDMQANLLNLEVYAQKDIEFHRSICEFSHNPILTRFMLSISDLLTEQVRRSVFNHVKLEESCEKHRYIVDALRVRNPKAALQAVERHLTQIPKLLTNVLHRSFALEA